MADFKVVHDDTLIELMWLGSRGPVLPHDFRYIGDEYMGTEYECAACHEVVNINASSTECTIDWRFPLHELRLRRELEQWKNKYGFNLTPPVMATCYEL